MSSTVIYFEAQRDLKRQVFAFTVVAVLVVLFLFTGITSVPVVTVQHSKQNYAVASELSGKWVMTPFGQRLKSEVITVPTGSIVLSNGKVLEPNGQLLNVRGANSNQLISSRTQPVPAGSSWVEYAEYNYCGGFFSPGGFGCFSGNWIVPNTPGFYDGQIIYLFIGLQPSGSSPPIIQPVLQYGFCGYQGWQLASWYAYSSTDYFHSPFYNIPAGTSIAGILKGIDFHNAGYGEWTSCFMYQKGLGSFCTVAQLSYQSHSAMKDLKFTSAFVTLEAYINGAMLTNPSLFPSSSPTVFNSLTEENQHGTYLSPGWKAYQCVSGSPFSVIVNSSNKITLYY